MATPVIMPRQGQTVESCIITKWYKNKGDRVEPGDILFTYETDKATFEEEAKESGIILEIFFEEGDDVPVLTNVCVIGEEGEDPAPYRPDGRANINSIESGDSEEEIAEEKEEKTEGLIETSVENGPSMEAGRIKISPRARNLAEKVGVDYRKAVPTGPEGRIIERDIRELIEKGPMATKAALGKYMDMDRKEIYPTGLGGRITTRDIDMAASSASSVPTHVSSDESESYEDVKLTNIRKLIAKSMHESLMNTAQLTLNSSFDATEILEFRQELKTRGERLGLDKITLNDIILFAVSRTILNHKEFNAHFLGDKMRIFKTVNLGVAVDTDRGLMVPTIFNSEKKSLLEISREAKELINQCREGKINPDYLKGGTFTITNLGSLGIESFTPIINPPQTAILGVNTIVQRAKIVDGEIKYYPAMGLSLTFDHRAVDGAPAARFLKELVENLENFRILLAK